MDRENTLTLKRVKEPPMKTYPERQLGGPQSGFPPPFIIGQELAPYLIVGIDFGSNFCRVCTFSNGAPYAVQPSSFSSLVEDVLAAPRETTQFVHSAKMCLAYDYLIKHGGACYSGAEVVGKMLRKLKEGVERSTERLLAKAVIAIPAGFNHAQREGLRRAAESAGVAVLGLINEPTAAALHACFMQNLRNGRYLIVSSGTYSFEVSVVHVQNRLIETKAVRGAQVLSGQAVNVALAEGIQAEFGLPDVHELILAVDQGKKDLDAKGAAVIQAGGQTITIDRNQAAKHLDRYISGMNSVCKSVISDAGIEETEITGTILTGNSTNLWLLREELQRRLPQAAMYTGNVSAGAAIYAALLVRQAKDWVIWDALANPVFVVQSNHIREVIGKNSPLPINGHASISPGEDGSAFATIMQRAPDSSDDLIPVASVRIVEELQQTEEGAAVDLSVTATADGILSIGARHKMLDVNLTVETSAPFREDQIVVDLDARGTTADAPPIEHIERFGSGITAKKYGAFWLVDAVLENSPASLAGVRVLDEILAVDDIAVEDLGHDVQSNLYGERGCVKRLWLRRNTSVLRVDVQCVLATDSWDQAEFQQFLADATISGDQKRIVRGLLNFAEREMALHPPIISDRALQAITRANEIAWKELAEDQSLCLEAASMSLKTLLPKVIYQKSQQDEVLARIEALQAMIVAYLTVSTQPKARVLRALVELVGDLRTAYDALGRHERPDELANITRTIGKQCEISDALIEAILAPGNTAAAAAGEQPLSWTKLRPGSTEIRRRYIHRLKLSLSPDIMEFSALNSSFNDMQDEIKKAHLVSPQVIAENPFHSAQCYLAHGRWWLHRELAGAPSEPALLELDEQVRENPRIVPCFNSKEAYEIARLILVMINQHSERGHDVGWQALCQSLLAIASAAVDDYQAASDCTDQVRRLVRQMQSETDTRVKDSGATVNVAHAHMSDVFATINNVCSVYLLKKRYHSIHNYCIGQLRKLDGVEAHGRKEMCMALLNLARVYAITAEFELARDAYERLLSLTEDDDQSLLNSLQSYTEFLVRMDDPAAGKMVERTEALGRKLGLINDETAPA